MAGRPLPSESEMRVRDIPVRTPSRIEASSDAGQQRDDGLADRVEHVADAVSRCRG